MAKVTVRIWLLAIDNAGSILIDNQGRLIYIGYRDEQRGKEAIPVKMVRRNLYPCVKCKYKNSEFPKTNIHTTTRQRYHMYLPNSLSGQCIDQGFAEYIGECEDFEPIS